MAGFGAASGAAGCDPGIGSDIVKESEVDVLKRGKESDLRRLVRVVKAADTLEVVAIGEKKWASDLAIRTRTDDKDIGGLNPALGRELGNYLPD